MATDEQQLFLFSVAEQKNLSYPRVKEKPALELDAESLQAWKVAIANHQQEVRSRPPEQQATLFEGEQNSEHPKGNPDAIDPFYLYLYNFFFFDLPANQHPSKPCLYFVIDINVPLILYVGETCKANQRWKGVHDCKRYVLNYRDLHARYGLSTAINTAFYWNVPAEVRPRQALELALILKWRSPFNKENWHYWGTPFIGEK